MQLAIAYSAGVLVANVLTLSRALPLSFCAASSLLASAALFGKRLTVAGVALSFAVFFAGASLAAIERTATSPDSLKQLLANGVIDEGQSLILTGVLEGPPEFARDRGLPADASRERCETWLGIKSFWISFFACYFQDCRE
jgi:hypothetical protein